MAGGWVGSTRRRELPSNWESHIRPAVLERDGYACQLRFDICEHRATDVDHIEDRDDHRLEALQAACGPCHDRKTSQQGNAAQVRNSRTPERHPGRTWEMPSRRRR